MSSCLGELGVLRCFRFTLRRNWRLTENKKRRKLLVNGQENVCLGFNSTRCTSARLETPSLKAVSTHTTESLLSRISPLRNGTFTGGILARALCQQPPSEVLSERV